MSLKKDILWRVGLIYGLFFLFALSILGRVIFLQVIEGDMWADKAESMSLKDITINPERGNIYDRKGNLLATSVPIYEVRMDMLSDAMPPGVLDANIDELSRKLSGLFGDKSAYQYKKGLLGARRKGNRYYLIHRNVSYSQLSAMKTFPVFELGRYKGGLIYLSHNKRVLPHKELSRRTIGYTYRGQNRNVVGIEGAYDKNLKGIVGLRLMQKLSGGVWMPVNDKNEVDPRNGQDIISTIDVNIQDVAHHALLRQLRQHNAHHGTAVLMEVATGDIRAIANLKRGDDGSYHESYNYAIGESAEPGSTFKLPALMAAMEDGFISIDDSVDTGKGEIRFYDKTIRDTREGGYGKISVKDVLVYSSNVGVSKLIQENYAGREKDFIKRIYSMGLNDKLGIEIKGEGSPEIKYPGDPLWSGISLPMMSHGYELMMTPIQTLSFYNAVANGGIMVKPRFVSEIRYHGKLVEKNEPEVLNPSIASASTIRDAREMLEGVVERGTARNLSNKEYRIAGKTGTAQIYDRESGYKGGKIQYQASFVGYFPADKPRYSCIVVVNAPSNSVYYGNLVAGPVFKEIADKVYASSLDMQHEEEWNDSIRLTLPFSKNGMLADLDRVLAEFGFDCEDGIRDDGWVEANATDSIVSINELKINPALVPNVVEMGLKDAVYLLENSGLEVEVKGWGKVKKQSVPPGTRIVKGRRIQLEMSFV